MISSVRTCFSLRMVTGSLSFAVLVLFNFSFSFHALDNRLVHLLPRSASSSWFMYIILSQPPGPLRVNSPHCLPHPTPLSTEYVLQNLCGSNDTRSPSGAAGGAATRIALLGLSLFPSGYHHLPFGASIRWLPSRQAQEHASGQT